MSQTVRCAADLLKLTPDLLLFAFRIVRSASALTQQNNTLADFIDRWSLLDGRLSTGSTPCDPWNDHHRSAS